MAVPAARRMLNRVWAMASCSSRAMRLRSSTMLSSRLFSYSRAFSMAMAAWAASRPMSDSSASVKRSPDSLSAR